MYKKNPKIETINPYDFYVSPQASGATITLSQLEDFAYSFSGIPVIKTSDPKDHPLYRVLKAKKEDKMT